VRLAWFRPKPQKITDDDKQRFSTAADWRQRMLAPSASALACLAVVATLQQAGASSATLYLCQSGQCVPNAGNAFELGFNLALAYDPATLGRNHRGASLDEAQQAGRLIELSQVPCEIPSPVREWWVDPVWARPPIPTAHIDKGIPLLLGISKISESQARR
jgi:hypothetical protein